MNYSLWFKIVYRETLQNSGKEKNHGLFRSKTTKLKKHSHMDPERGKISMSWLSICLERLF
jgi:hypothetical protein